MKKSTRLIQRDTSACRSMALALALAHSMYHGVTSASASYDLVMPQFLREPKARPQRVSGCFVAQFAVKRCSENYQQACFESHICKFTLLTAA
jgi:hypothetical protein